MNSVPEHPERDWFKETNTHLDEKSYTLCIGSRGAGGIVPWVCCGDGEVDVGWDEAEGASPDLGVRQVVS